MKKIEKRIRIVKKTTTNELGGIRHLLNVYPTGILSMVSDTFDLWRMCTEYLPVLKEEIMARDGKLVIRPDSGDPVNILCGMRVMTEDEFKAFVYTDEYSYKTNGITILKDGVYYEPEVNHWPDGCVDWAGADMDGKTYSEHEVKGVIELLWDVFGGTINEQGYKVLDPHIGAIYGDSITIDRADEICARLAAKGFASTNVVLGIGSFTYQYNTRDTFGFAMKATYVEVNGEGREIFKDPITDDGTKKSATGLLLVTRPNDGDYQLFDKVNWNNEANGELKTIYRDGKFHNATTLDKIRNRLK
jgi:nicotinamide phosphoribosyltransferase